MTYFRLINLNFDKFRDIPHSTVNSIFITLRFRPRFLHRGNHLAVRIKNRVDQVLCKKGAHSKQLRSILRWLCWFKSSGSVVSRVARSMTQTVTIFSGQSVISRVYTSRFGNGTASLEPRPRWYKKKVPGTVTLWKTPQMWTVLNHTVQWKSAITVPCPACVREVVWW